MIKFKKIRDTITKFLKRKGTETITTNMIREFQSDSSILSLNKSAILNVASQRHLERINCIVSKNFLIRFF
ncbi:hypothetical protein [Leptospira interrogans]|uniref:Uncharacterized protein n=3 Tax=Leptospira interrogans TaxID=173 RepID=Q8F9R9_LEPIN|nr:hypothetical protein [Leptospira interrogans]AAN47320.1 hypothetical protein LA_0121 [Leptospira interrogans serovar Lai str. 56601]AER00928.1 hypothetical protein LIF_A0109 [Leptospira interrogans serovar Lai str. IPAV]QOI49123.1 hypothetical protein Lepto1489_00575 [Leptospira interrogans serovar Bataviae]